ncbi:hypothetical protein L1887_41941 [Cichorium endivia]|nr:hypothetical protein L1887_41941 [Cichorium endivia]
MESDLLTLKKFSLVLSSQQPDQNNHKTLQVKPQIHKVIDFNSDGRYKCTKKRRRNQVAQLTAQIDMNVDVSQSFKLSKKFIKVLIIATGSNQSPKALIYKQREENKNKGKKTLVREEKVKMLTPKEARYAIQLSGKTFLNVRPSTEHEKAWVKGSTWIPIFDVDAHFDAGTLSRKVTSYMIGDYGYDFLKSGSK